VAVLIAFLAVVGFVQAGRWQLRRLDERRSRNATISARMAAPVVPLAQARGDLDDAPAALLYRRVTATGTYDLDREVILQARTLDGRSGHEVLTPLLLDDGSLLVVDRGWVPIDVEGPPVVGAEPPGERVTVTGMLAPSQTHGALGSLPDSGSPERIGRADLAVLQRIWGTPVVPVLLRLERQDPPQEGPFPIPLPPPELDEGPHLGYAVQWFLFAVVVLVGFPVLLYRTARASQDEGPASDR